MMPVRRGTGPPGGFRRKSNDRLRFPRPPHPLLRRPTQTEDNVALKRLMTVLCLCASCLPMLWPAGVQAQSSATKAAAAKAEKAPAAKDVSPLLLEIIGRHDIPGMTAVLIEGDTVVATGAAGLRKRGGKDKVTL